MLRPQNNGTREAFRLDGVWDLTPDTGGSGRDAGWFRGPLPSARPVAVPASYNDLYAVDDLRDHVGEVWYQRRAHVPSGWGDVRIVLRFDAACHRASVWVDDELVAEHEGGYTPFEADITRLVEPGRRFRITVAVDNELSFRSIPPGVVVAGPDGRRTQRYFHDFFNYAGLHRSVWLHTRPTAHVDDVTVVTDLDGSTGIVDYRIGVAGDESTSADVRVVLLDADGAEVAASTGREGRLVVPDARRWAPGDGYLHDLVVELVDDGAVTDRYVQPVGIRSVRVDGTRFLINGEPFHFTGFGMHEDHLVRGKGHDAASMIRDFELLGWTGANSFRTAHYPYAEEVLDHADRLGIVVIDETAAVGLNLQLAAMSGGLPPGVPASTYSDSSVDAGSQAVHRVAIEELIARDKNHPSVVLWSIANEPESGTDAAVDYFAPLFDAARAADPSRPVGFVNVMLEPADRCKVTALADVVMINRYYGWYVATGDLPAAERMLTDELQRWTELHDKPILVTEYGADTMPGFHSVGRELWTEEYQVDFLDMHHRVFDRFDAVVGEHVWNFADFDTATTLMRVGGNKKGVFTRARDPKAAAHLVRARWTGGAASG